MEYAAKYKRYNTLRRIKEVHEFIYTEAMFVAMINKDKEALAPRIDARSDEGNYGLFTRVECGVLQ